MSFKEGDLVTRRSYNSDIIFKIEKIELNKVVLRSYRLRLMADAPLKDLIKYENKNKKSLYRNMVLESYDYLKRQQRNLILNGERAKKSDNDLKKGFREIPGRVLHLDGDRDYLQMSLQNYKNLQIDARGFFVPEKGQPEKILRYLRAYHPDILVLTGHDGFVDDCNYHTSNYFIESVKKARKFISDLDELVIFAGACQSSYQKLIDNGANFASSPKNRLLHFLDPVLIAEKIAYTSVREVLSVKDIIKITITEDGVGGVETRGKLRLCYP